MFLVLAPAVRRHVHDRTFEQLEQPLLHTLAAHVAGNRGVVALAGNLVDFVDKDDAPLGGLHVVVGHLKQAGENALYILAHVTGLGKHRGIDNGKGHLEQPGYCLGQQGLAGTRGTHHNDIRLLYLHIVGIVGRILHDAFVVVVDRHGQVALGIILPDDILVEKRLYLLGLGQLLARNRPFRIFLPLLVQILFGKEVGLFGTLVADAAVTAGHQQPHLVFTSSAETTLLTFRHCSNRFSWI